MRLVIVIKMTVYAELNNQTKALAFDRRGLTSQACGIPYGIPYGLKKFGVNVGLIFSRSKKSRQ